MGRLKLAFITLTKSKAEAKAKAKMEVEQEQEQEKEEVKTDAARIDSFIYSRYHSVCHSVIVSVGRAAAAVDQGATASSTLAAVPRLMLQAVS